MNQEGRAVVMGEQELSAKTEDLLNSLKNQSRERMKSRRKSRGEIVLNHFKAALGENYLPIEPFLRVIEGNVRLVIPNHLVIAVQGMQDFMMVAGDNTSHITGIRYSLIENCLGGEANTAHFYDFADALAAAEDGYKIMSESNQDGSGL